MKIFNAIAFMFFMLSHNIGFDFAKSRCKLYNSVKNNMPFSLISLLYKLHKGAIRLKYFSIESLKWRQMWIRWRGARTWLLQRRRLSPTSEGEKNWKNWKKRRKKENKWAAAQSGLIWAKKLWKNEELRVCSKNPMERIVKFSLYVPVAKKGWTHFSLSCNF